MTSAQVTGASAARLFDQAASYQQSGDFFAACNLLTELIEAYPGVAALHLKKGTVLWSQQKFRQAIKCFDQAIILDPASPEAHFCKATAQQSLGESAAALASYDDALAIRPDYVEALNNKAVLLKEAGRIGDAIQAYKSAIDVRPDCIQAWVGKSLCELLLGKFEAGWQSYEWRKKKFGPWGHRSEAPEWQGENLSGKTLLIQAEQGLGDTIQFSRYAKLAKGPGAKIIFQVHDRLVKLLSTLDSDIEVVSATQLTPACDYHLMLLSMPGMFWKRSKHTSSENAYLTADPELVALWKHRTGPEGFKVGVHWQGERKWEGLDKTSDKERSFSFLEFYGVSQIPGVRLISLQKNDGLDQLEEGRADIPIELPGGSFDDGPDAFLDSAAIIANLDLVITSDTAMAHLASALGCEVWIALQYVPDWRWQLGRSDTIWYPQTRLFRQTTRGNWSEVFSEMECELRQRLSQMADVVARPLIPVSWGEVIDKITILEIKSNRLIAEDALANVWKELRFLRDCAAQAMRVTEIEPLALRLKNVNETLWAAEETVRRKERDGLFDQEFIATARFIYAHNGERAEIKGKISRLLGSELIEEKNYRTSVYAT